jgi:hypothetical protein
MKFTATLFTVALAAGAVSAATTTSVSMSPQASCLTHCPQDENWANCAAQCEGVPHPETSNVIDTTKCSMQCDQGDGSPADTKAYGECLQKCSDQFYYTSNTGVAVPTTAAPVATESGETVTDVATTATEGETSPTNGGPTNGGPTGMTTTKKGGSSGPAATESGKGAQSTASDPANMLQIGGPVTGIAALVVAIFAL